MKLLAQKSLKTELQLKSYRVFYIAGARLQICRGKFLNQIQNRRVDLNL
jgi:hypothetical protein